MWSAWQCVFRAYNSFTFRSLMTARSRSTCRRARRSTASGLARPRERRVPWWASSVRRIRRTAAQGACSPVVTHHLQHRVDEHAFVRLGVGQQISCVTGDAARVSTDCECGGRACHATNVRGAHNTCCCRSYRRVVCAHSEVKTRQRGRASVTSAFQPGPGVHGCARAAPED